MGAWAPYPRAGYPSQAMSGTDSWRDVAHHLRDSARLRAQLPPERVALQAEALRVAGPVKGWRVLEIGCGAGALAQKLAAAGAQVTAIDASPAAVHGADHDAKEAGVLPKPEFAVADLLEPASLPRGPFDLAICVLALHESADPAAALRAAAKLLDPRGRLILALEHPWRAPARANSGPLGSLPALLAALRAAGLRWVEAAEPVPPGAPGDRPHHLIVSAERTSKRPRNRGTSRKHRLE
jgi:SAM-dependent methyltransferase